MNEGYLPSTIRDNILTLQTIISLGPDLRQFEPDLIISQHQLSVLGALFHYLDDVFHILMIRDKSMIPSKNTEWPLTIFYNRVVNFVLENTDLSFANSEYIAQEYANYWSIQPSIVYPFVRLPDYCTSHEGEAFLHVNPSTHKGIEVTLDIARKLSSRRFIVVGDCSDPEVEREMKDLDNLEFRGYVTDMASVYAETKLVLMPTLTPEPFGRVPIEAGAGGIPTLCSGTGGLREAVGYERFVIESNDPADYQSRIKTIESNYDYYSDLARKNTKEKSAKQQMTLLHQMVYDRLDINLS